MSTQQIHNFGLVDEIGDSFEFTAEAAGGDSCRLVAVLQTERGPRRTEVAAVSTELWNAVAGAVVRELAAEMGETEREKRPPSLRPGTNRISPLVGRELGVLLIALMEEGAADRVDALLHAWRELAREERWWLYAKAAAPGQRVGFGWRRALLHAFSETSETRVAPPAEDQKKKNCGSIAKPSSQKQGARGPHPSLNSAVLSSARSQQPQPKVRQPTAKATKPTKTKPKKTKPKVKQAKTKRVTSESLSPGVPNANPRKHRKTTK